MALKRAYELCQSVSRCLMALAVASVLVACGGAGLGAGSIHESVEKAAADLSTTAAAGLPSITLNFSGVTQAAVRVVRETDNVVLFGRIVQHNETLTMPTVSAYRVEARCTSRLPAYTCSIQSAAELAGKVTLKLYAGRSVLLASPLPARPICATCGQLTAMACRSTSLRTKTVIRCNCPGPIWAVGEFPKSG